MSATATEPTIITVDATKVLLKKVLVAFVVGFAPVFLGGITTGYQHIVEALSSGGEVDLNLLTILGLSLASGAVTALTRAVLAVIPGLNLVESDKLHSLGREGKQPTTIVYGTPLPASPPVKTTETPAPMPEPPTEPPTAKPSG